jgi:hypothetical protein
MPPVIAAIVAALVWAGASAAWAAFLAPVILSLGASLVLGAISKLFAKGSNSSSLISQAASRTVTSRQAVAPWRAMYGANRVGGVITFLHVTGANNEKLHLVITTAGHELNAIPAMYFDGVLVPLDGSGNATGNFAGFVHAEFNLGTRTQAAFAGLVAAAPGVWTSASRQRNRAGAYVQLTWDVSKFPNGVPNITFDVQGRPLVYDPRTGGFAYTSNAALCIADYLTNASFGLVAQTKYPITAAMLANSGFSNFNAANLVDGDITTNGWSNNTTNANSTITVDLGSGNPQEFRRCRFYLSTTGQVQTYHVQRSDDNITYTSAEEHSATGMLPDVAGWNEVELAPNGAHRYWRILAIATITEAGFVNELEFYTSDVDSTLLTAAANTCDELVNILPSGTQNRFAIDGSFDTSESPANVIGRMNSAMGGSVLYVAGKWGIYPGIWRAPTISLSDADFRGPMTVQTRLTHRDLYNGVKGMFISPTNNWQAADYPPFQSTAYLQEDNNEALWLDVELPFTINGAMAQRLSKIALRRARHQITVHGPFKLTAYQIQPLDVIQLSHPRFGWVNKTFEVADCTLSYVPDASGAPALGVDLTLREADSTIYDWSTADEIALSSPPVPTLPQNTVVQPPTALVLTSQEVIRIADGLTTSTIIVSWTAPADQFVLSGGHIRVQYKKHADSLWLDGGKVDGSATKQTIAPVFDNVLYDVQIWAENASGAKSSTVSGTVTPSGTSHGSTPMATGPGFSYTSTTTSITINWANFIIARADNTTTALADSSQAITGLAAATTYYFYPYFDEASGTLKFLSASDTTFPTLAGVKFTNSTSGYVSTATSVTPSTTLSIECWMKDSSAVDGIAVEHTNVQTGTPATDDFVFSMAGGAPRVKVGAGQLTGNAINDGLWHHIVIVQSGSTTTIYVDGTQVVTGTTATITAIAGFWRISSNFGNISEHVTDGTFGRVAIYNGVALTAAKIASHYNAMINKGIAAYETAVTADSPTYWWKLQETSGTSAADSAGTNTGTYQATFTLNDSAPLIGQNGSPAIAWSYKAYLVAQQQSLGGRIPLSNGGMAASTTAAGTGGGSGGGVGGARNVL